MYRLLVYPEYKIQDIPVFPEYDPKLGPALTISFFFGYWIVSFISVNISGAHYNPAVTIAYLFKKETGKFNRITVIFYLLA